MTDTNRASGRTTRIIIKVIKDALATPGEVIYCKDHFDRAYAHEHVTAIAARLLKRMGVPHRANIKEHTIMVLLFQGK